jgi:hypothetical protein
MAFSDRLKIDRAKKLSFLKFRSDERFVLSIFNAAAFLHNQDPDRTSARTGFGVGDVPRYAPLREVPQRNTDAG